MSEGHETENTEIEENESAEISFAEQEFSNYCEVNEIDHEYNRRG